MTTIVARAPEGTGGLQQHAKLIPLLITLAVGLVIWFIPPPEGVELVAWHLLAIFVATIIGIILKPMPMGAVALTGIVATALTGTLSIGDALSGFGNTTIWLIVIAFFISRGFIKTGLGERIAYYFMSIIGKRSLGLAYGLIGTDLVLAPAIPSNTARGGGVVYPVLRAVAKAYGSEPDDGTANKLGAFLIRATFQGLIVTSAMFLTAMAANPLAAELAAAQGIDITWTRWAIAASVPGLVSLILVPYLIYRLNPPEIKETPEAANIARQKLKEMGKVKAEEWVMLVAFVLLIGLWIFGDALSISATTTAFVGLGLLLLAGVLSWGDILNERNAWDTLVWFAALVMMASFLNSLGLIPWFSEKMGGVVGGYAWVPAFLILSLVYFYSHYFFASCTAHVSSMYAAFLVVAIVAGTPPLLAALVLAFFSNLFACTTHYGTGPAPVLYGAGYVEMGDWWKVGAIMSVVNIAIWLLVGGLWWKLIGLW
ncbi:MAG: anion permease [Anaerolineaceae bacterium]|nr:anion permease [Anaerolineaceae bacterium]